MKRTHSHLWFSLPLLGWGIAAVLKVAQGSSTVAMIVGAGMMSAIIGDAKPEYNMVYVATAVGTGSLMGSWMNDSGFWVFTKMGGLTESESLRSWTPLLMVLSLVGLVVTVALSQVLPMQQALAPVCSLLESLENLVINYLKHYNNIYEYNK